MYCKNCGANNRNDSKYCLNCGQQLPDYTKPLENLLMPEDVENAQAAVKQKQKVARAVLIVDIIAWVTFFIATVFLVLSFFKIKFAAIITSLMLLVVYFILTAVKAILKKKERKVEEKTIIK